MHTYGYADKKPELRNRLSRIEGQVRGVAKMVEDDTYCIDILTQIGAVRAAMDKVALALLKDHTEHCIANGQGRDTTAQADELVAAVARLLK